MTDLLPATLPLAERVGRDIRDLIAGGKLRPGQRLSEIGMAERLGVSRNTLREAFRALTNDGLLKHEANRGVSVAVPSMAAVMDIYRVRRLIEVQALREAFAQHPAVGGMAAAVERARLCAARRDWVGVGNANMDFHAAIVDLADSPRLNDLFARLATELRLAFGLVDEPEVMHAPYVAQNEQIVAMLRRGETEEAAQRLGQYLAQSERFVLAALARLQGAAG